jgi:hypothetical protein
LRTEPYRHQAEEYEASKGLEARALLWQMRTGKSKVIVDTAFHLRDDLAIEGAIINAPNGVHANWTRRELPKHSWDDGYSALAWRSRRPDMDEVAAHFARHAEFPILAVNNEVLPNPRAQAAIKGMLKRGRLLYVADECHDFRSPGSRRTKLARGLSAKCAYRRILTGTAVLNSPLHAFSQFELLQKGALGYTRYDEFRSRFATAVMHTTRSGRQFPEWRPRDLGELRERLARWSSVVLRADVDDMPELIEDERLVYMSASQSEAYLRMVKEWKLDLDAGSVSVKEGGARMMKLQQILGGFVITDDGEVRSIEDNPPRLDAVVEQVVGTLPGKTIVWCRFREDIRRVVARLREEGFDPVEYHGGVSAGLRDETEDRFRDDPTANPLVGQPQSGGQGLDLSTADTVVNYSHSHNSIIREQSKERATAIGGKSVGLVDLRTPGSVDDVILECAAENLSVSEYLTGPGLKLRLQEILDATDV